MYCSRVCLRQVTCKWQADLLASTHLKGIDDADARDALSVVRAQQQRHVDEAVTVQAQLALDVVHAVVLHILAVLKDVPVIVEATPLHLLSQFPTVLAKPDR